MLALLLSQAVSNYMPRQMVSKQLEEMLNAGVGKIKHAYIIYILYNITESFVSIYKSRVCLLSVHLSVFLVSATPP